MAVVDVGAVKRYDVTQFLHKDDVSIATFFGFFKLN